MDNKRVKRTIIAGESSGAASPVLRPADALMNNAMSTVIGVTSPGSFVRMTGMSTIARKRASELLVPVTVAALLLLVWAYWTA
jgi:hypothetical protein